MSYKNAGTDILRIEHLSKTFRSHWLFRPIHAVQDLSLSIQRGEAFGFLGHNGAGKTTTIKCIMGLIKTTAGEIYFENEKLVTSAQHKTISYLPEQPYFYDHLTVGETLEFFATLHDMKGAQRSKRVREVLEEVGLSHREKSKVRTLSKGLQQRLGLAQALLNNPALLILDEPFSGLDPVGRLEVRELLLHYKELGTTLILSSHILSDVEDICERVSIMSHGVLREVIDLADLPDRFGEKYELVLRGEPLENGFAGALQSIAQSYSVNEGTQGLLHCFTFSAYTHAEDAMRQALRYGVVVVDFHRVQPHLEEIFMQITGRHYTDPNAASKPITDRPSLGV